MDDYYVSDENKADIRALYNVTDNDVKLQVTLLKEWAQSRPRLPKECQDEIFLNIILLRSKFREEFAKTLLENHFEYLRKYPEIFQYLGTFKPSEEVGITVAVPKMTSKFERIVILKLLPGNMATKSIDMHQLVVIATTSSLLMYDNDYVDSIRCIFDFKGATMMHVFKLNLIELYKLASIVQNMLKMRVSGIEIINSPRIVPLLLRTAKILLTKKIFSRITTHSDLSSLHKNIPLESLPRDYGGEAESTEELVVMWDHIVEAHQSFFENVASLSRGNDPYEDNKTEPTLLQMGKEDKV